MYSSEVAVLRRRTELHEGRSQGQRILSQSEAVGRFQGNQKWFMKVPISSVFLFLDNY